MFGVDLDRADTRTKRGVEKRWGVLFQQGALFSSLTVRQNIQFPVRENLKVSQRLLDEIVVAKLGMVGAASRGRRSLSVRTVRRHDQTRRAGGVRSRSIPNWSSSTSRPPASIRSVPAISMNWCGPCSVL